MKNIVLTSILCAAISGCLSATTKQAGEITASSTTAANGEVHYSPTNEQSRVLLDMVVSISQNAFQFQYLPSYYDLAAAEEGFSPPRIFRSGGYDYVTFPVLTLCANRNAPIGKPGAQWKVADSNPSSLFSIPGAMLISTGNQWSLMFSAPLDAFEKKLNEQGKLVVVGGKTVVFPTRRSEYASSQPAAVERRSQQGALRSTIVKGEQLMRKYPERRIRVRDWVQDVAWQTLGNGKTRYERIEQDVKRVLPNESDERRQEIVKEVNSEMNKFDKEAAQMPDVDAATVMRLMSIARKSGA